MAKWRDLIREALEENGELWSDVVVNTLTDEELDAPFDDSYGGVEGKAFFLWTKERVYFPACYDGSEWVVSVPRNPCDEIPAHIGGG